VNTFEELGGRLLELAFQLPKATQPGHFNKHPRRPQSGRRNLVSKDDKRFIDTDQQCWSSGVSEIQLSQLVDSLRIRFGAGGGSA